MADNTKSQINESTLQQVRTEATGSTFSDDVVLDRIIFKFCMDAVGQIADKMDEQLKELNDGQKKVYYLQKFIKWINANTSADDASVTFDNSAEVQELLAKAKELGVMLDEGKLNYTSEERERLIENLHMTTDDLNTKNEALLRKSTRLEDIRHEMWQMANQLIKILQNTKTTIARNISGR